MAHAPLDCRVLAPGRALKPGDKIACPVCRRLVYLSEPPMDENHDPWRGSEDARVQVHRIEHKPAPQ